MKLHYFEAVNSASGGFNWGKFAVGLFGPDEWEWRSATTDENGETSPYPVLRTQGWSRRHLWVMDLATGEGALFLPGGSARADLNKHQIWVCVLYEAFLAWLYEQARERGGRLTDEDLAELPKLVEVAVPSAWAGYRRGGKLLSELVAAFAAGEMTLEDIATELNAHGISPEDLRVAQIRAEGE
ncbi:hypothetical protein [Nonomuraea gerenzanensis]|uniref:hypothetical protein n=1 Tax=Nonomuraea gerenzanensis TaxID=93944 RepID=UPI001CD9639F|nr:hypothetical protein [Nonomuraea gerenzanensis]UBU12925.1 hypothetical protein LCN96_53240 [Nonomuraea gerenzanensis]